MCTAICFRAGDGYFGRNLDIECGFREEVTITPRQFTFSLENGRKFKTQYALIGTAAVLDGVPLYYEATNEKGLSMAGLRFADSAVYLEPKTGEDNITPSEIIPYLLGQADSVSAARKLLSTMRLTNVPFRADLPLSPLHYMMSDKDTSIVVEPRADGLHVYENPYEVMTNNPPFPYHLWNIRNYRNLTPAYGENTFSEAYDLPAYATGMASFGLPGDASSASRFVRAAYHLTNAKQSTDETENVTQFFHVLDSVSMLKGTVKTKNNADDYTLYSSCCNLRTGRYYFKCYESPAISFVDLHSHKLDGKDLIRYPLSQKATFHVAER